MGGTVTQRPPLHLPDLNIFRHLFRMNEPSSLPPPPLTTCLFTPVHSCARSLPVRPSCASTKPCSGQKGAWHHPARTILLR